MNIFPFTRSTTARLVIVAVLFTLISSCSVTTPADSQAPLSLLVKHSSCQKKLDKYARCFNRLQQALDFSQSIPPEVQVHIDVSAGNYFERVMIGRANLIIRGAGVGVTRIQYDLDASRGQAFHRDGWGTPGSATLTVNAVDISLSDMTIENTFDFIANDQKLKGDPTKVKASQGVAVLLDEHSDKVAFNRVAILGYQDTLFAHGKRAYITNSTIAGNVDFIFGRGQVLIEHSDIISRNRGKAIKPGELTGYVTAASTDISNKYGLVFIHSRLKSEPGVPTQSVSLGRPWHPTTTFSDGRYADPNAVGQVMFISCYMGAHIHPHRWSSMRGTGRDGSKSLVFSPEESRFYEYNSTGPGAPFYDELTAELPRSSFNKTRIEQIKKEILKGWMPFGFSN